MVLSSLILSLVPDVAEQQNCDSEKWLLMHGYIKRVLLKSCLFNYRIFPDCCGPPSQPDLFKRYTRMLLGCGSTGEVSQWVCSRSVQCFESGTTSAENGFFQTFATIRDGETVAVKCHAYSKSCIGSFSGGVAPTNYPTKLSTGIKERILGARLAGADGIGKENVSTLLASWFDRHGLWLVFKLVHHAKGLDEILAPNSSDRDAICSKSIAWTAALFQQFALALQFIGNQRVVQRDGGLSNWMVSGLDRELPKVTLIDFGLALSAHEPLTAEDSNASLVQHMSAYEAGIDTISAPPGREIFGDMFFDAPGTERLSPIDWCYSPGATGPKFPPPPELRVVRETLSKDVADVILSRGCELPYSSGYDVWVLGWTFVQIILGERWEDWKHEEIGDLLIEHVRSHFFSKEYQIHVPWELGLQPPAWRLAILAHGAEHFQKSFLDDFFTLASKRIISRGLHVATPVQTEFVRPESKLRTIISRMIDYCPAHREEYLKSGSLLRDLGDLSVGETGVA